MTTAKHFRHRLFPRVRHARHLTGFLASESAALTSSASAQTVAPVRTTNTKAEALVVVGGQPAANATLRIGNFLYTFKSALTEAKAAGTLTNDATNVTAADTVTINGAVYTYKAALTEAKAAGTLTNDTVNVTDADTVTIDGKVYTFQGTLTNVDGHVKIGASASASMTNLFHAINASGGTVGTDYATLTTAHATVVATNPSATTVVVTAKTVGVAGNALATVEASTHLAWGAATLAGGVASVANEVKVGGSATASVTNLFEAINAGSNAGTDYSTATVAHATVVATNPTATTVVVTAKTPGVSGNLLTTTEASTHLAWGAALMAGGVDPIVNQVLIDDTSAHTRDNLLVAINAGAGAGTKYSTGTVIHDKVVATAATNDVLLTANDVSNVVAGMSVRLTSSSVNYTAPAGLDGPAWTATSHSFEDGEGPVLLTSSGTAPAGSPAATVQLWVHKIDANKVALATSLEALRKGNFIRTTSAGSGTHSITRAANAAGIFAVLKRNPAAAIKAATDIDALH